MSASTNHLHEMYDLKIENSLIQKEKLQKELKMRFENSLIQKEKLQNELKIRELYE